MKLDHLIGLPFLAAILLFVIVLFSLPGAPASSDPTAPPPGVIAPKNLVYIGAFRLPDGPEEHDWSWSGQALAFRADGDPEGPADGHPGSLFGTGHNWHQWVSEISIPKPVVSTDKKPTDLPTAKTLQAFADIRGGKWTDLEQARAGLAVLPVMGEQASAKLYCCWGPHMDEESAAASHAYCELDLKKPELAGPWRIKGVSNYVTVDYLLPIPADWAKAHTGGRRLGTGRFRDGGQGSMGPTLFALGPWLDGNPPDADARLSAVTLLCYDAVTAEAPVTLRDYHHSDDWSGAAWMTAGETSAVAFVGTKGVGKCWYGFANGVVWPEEGPWPEVPAYPNDQRGWWSTTFAAQILLYDPTDLAAVADGKAKPSSPQPYAVIDITKHLFAKRDRPELHLLGACAFDPKSRTLYVVEPRADEDKSIIHCWQVK